MKEGTKNKVRKKGQGKEKGSKGGKNESERIIYIKERKELLKKEK